ncbi:GGDEF domain-containing protein [Paenibacillus senegalensis]|uniref:GGDEF domain-containing protein n=1 Tax=Paenibacillus senegalensis TaxID=1465766 RepID=UPI000288D7B3|nr:GGDEF domain-containing protein [Paenibacillus senegalensis]
MKAYYAEKMHDYSLPGFTVAFVLLLGLCAALFNPFAQLWPILVCMLLVGFAGTVWGGMSGLAASLAAAMFLGIGLQRAGVGWFSMELLGWTAAFLATAYMTGRLHHWLAVRMPMDSSALQLRTMQEAYEHACNHRKPFSLIIIDIKYFHSFRSMYGKRETIHLLNQFSEKLWSCTRTEDRKFQLSGHKFAVLLPGRTADDADNVIRQLEEALAIHTLIDKDKQVHLSLTFGLAEYSDGMASAQDLLEQAEKELVTYVA